MAHYTPHQKKIIERYYDRKDQILLARLQEIVSELYLADSEAKLKRLWSRAGKAMAGLKAPESIRRHIMEQKKPDVLAKNLTQWLKNGPTA